VSVKLKLLGLVKTHIIAFLLPVPDPRVLVQGLKVSITEASTPDFGLGAHGRQWHWYIHLYSINALLTVNVITIDYEASGLEQFRENFLAYHKARHSTIGVY
jgi:hypothetical protein